MDELWQNQIEEDRAYELYIAEQEHEASLLNTRGKTHGDFKSNSRLVQFMKDMLRSSNNWNDLEEYQREALDMTLHKIGRIMTGDHKFIDSWLDICGYNQLVIDQLLEDPEATNVRNVKTSNIKGIWNDVSDL